jgi:uncharacterized repeat protein (TIGR01451 family)
MTPQYKLPPVGEILCDGGDGGLPAVVLRDGEVAGLETNDTVAHYKTPDGQTVILPTNEVCIYAPRFGAVRHVAGVNIAAESRGAEGLGTDLSLASTEGRREPTTSLQEEEALATVAQRPSSLLRTQQKIGGLANDEGILRASGSDLPFESLQALRFELVDNLDSPLILAGMINAIHWTHDLGVQVAIDRRKAQVLATDRRAALIYHIEEPNEPRLEVAKLADRAAAHPGDVVHFAIKYKNIGNRPITDLTIVDNLTTRLVYVEDSQQSDRPAEFSTQVNDASSLILKWQVQGPLEAGQGGLIQFACRVR